MLDAWRAEPDFLMRRHHARALGEAGTSAALEALVTLLAEEADPQVLRGALTEALGGYRDPRAAAALRG